MATLDKYGYRKYLNEKGFNDDEITYDQNTQSVMAKGKFFGNATPEADGSTYNTRANLDTMYKGYMGNTMYEKYANQATQKPAEVKVTPYKPLDMQTLYSDPTYQTGLQAAQMGAATQQGNTLAKLRSMGQGKSSYSEGVANQIGHQAMTNFNAQIIPQLTTQHYNQYLKDTELAQKAEAENYARNNTHAGNLKSVAGDYLGMYNDDLTRQDTDKSNRIKYAEKLREDFGTQVDVKNDYGLMDEQVRGMQTIKASTEQRQMFQEEVAASDKLGFVTPELAAYLGVEPYSNTLSAETLIRDTAYKMGMLGVQNRQAANSERQTAINGYNAETARSAQDLKSSEQDSKLKFDRGIEVYKATGQMPPYMSEFGIDVQGLSSPQYADDLNAMYQLLSSGQAKPQDLIRSIDDKVKIGAEPAEGGERMKQAIYKLYPNLDPANKKTTNENAAFSTSGENAVVNRDWLKRAAALGVWGISRFAGQ